MYPIVLEMFLNSFFKRVTIDTKADPLFLHAENLIRIFLL
jgi:hypothetical protein